MNEAWSKLNELEQTYNSMITKTYRLQSNHICLQMLSGEEDGHPDKVSVWPRDFENITSQRSILQVSFSSFANFKKMQLRMQREEKNTSEKKEVVALSSELTGKMSSELELEIEKISIFRSNWNLKKESFSLIEGINNKLARRASSIFCVKSERSLVNSINF